MFRRVPDAGCSRCPAIEYHRVDRWIHLLLSLLLLYNPPSQLELRDRTQQHAQHHIDFIKEEIRYAG
jgi:hypothetical protein